MAKKAEKISEKAYDLAMKNLASFLRPASAVDVPEFIPTGHLQLDIAITQGIDPESDIDFNELNLEERGFPLGKLVEISGQEGSGKSSLAYRVVGYAQKKGYKCGWIDSEQSFSPSLAEINGVDKTSLAFADLKDIEEPDHLYSAEEVFDRICDMFVRW
jgi:recombination protein RecA